MYCFAGETRCGSGAPEHTSINLERSKESCKTTSSDTELKITLIELYINEVVSSRS